MKIDDPKIVGLQEMVTAAQHEFDMAIAFHEVWKPATYDKELHSRLGVSYATQAFLVVRNALRREMLLALMRMWDTNSRAIRMGSIADTLREDSVIELLASDRASRFVKHALIDESAVVDQMRDDLRKRANDAVLLIAKYSRGGKSEGAFKKIRALRHERLAHRQLAQTTAMTTGADATDEEIEEFYQDNSKLIEILLGLVSAIAYAPQDTAYIFGFYADHFWKRVS